MAEPALFIDGWDASDAGLTVTGTLEGARGLSPRSYPSARVPGRGEVRLSSEPEIHARRITVRGTVTGEDMDEMHENLDELRDRLDTGGEEAEISFVDDADRHYLGVATGLDDSAQKPDQIQPWTHVTIVFVCHDPEIQEDA